jgi:methylphosphotriester-DNA--protein-cysteine methyltransferase
MTTREDKIRAVMNRDSTSDGEFIYGVKSTGIYCRPSCPSRRPKPENIQLFDSPKEAEEAGYRACMRCDPSEFHPPNEAFVERITNYIARNIDRNLSLGRLAEEFGVSKYHLQRTFKSILGMSPRQLSRHGVLNCSRPMSETVRKWTRQCMNLVSSQEAGSTRRSRRKWG